MLWPPAHMAYDVVTSTRTQLYPNPKANPAGTSTMGTNMVQTITIPRTTH